MASDSDLPAPFFGDILPVQYPRGSNGQHGQGHGQGPMFHNDNGNRNNGPMGHGMMNDMPPYGQGQGHFQSNNNMGTRDGGHFNRSGPGGINNMNMNMNMNMENQRGRGYGGLGGPGPGQGGDPLIDVDVLVGADGICCMAL